MNRFFRKVFGLGSSSGSRPAPSAPFVLTAPDGPAVAAARSLDQRVQGGLKSWECVGITGDGVVTHAIEAATKGEVRARLKEILGIHPRERLPSGWVIMRASQEPQDPQEPSAVEPAAEARAEGSTADGS